MGTMKYLCLILVLASCAPHPKPPLYKWKPQVIEQVQAEVEEVTAAVFGELKSLDRVKRQ